MISKNRAIWLSLLLVAAVVGAAVYFNTDASHIRNKILPNYGIKYAAKIPSVANMNQGSEFDEDIPFGGLVNKPHHSQRPNKESAISKTDTDQEDPKLAEKLKEKEDETTNPANLEGELNEKGDPEKEEKNPAHDELRLQKLEKREKELDKERRKHATEKSQFAAMKQKQMQELQESHNKLNLAEEKENRKREDFNKRLEDKVQVKTADSVSHKKESRLKEFQSLLNEKEAKLRADKRKFEEDKAKVEALKAALVQQRGLLDEEKARIEKDRLKLQTDLEDVERQKKLISDQRQSQLQQEQALAPSGDTGSIWNGMAPGEITGRYPEIIPMANYKLRPFIDPSDFNAAGLERHPNSIDDMSGAEAENRFYTLVNMEHVSCTNTQRLGNLQDGGWDICVSPPYEPKQNDCLVYSFGINNDWSFDDGISRRYGCQVKAFDPSMQIGDHAHSPKVYFYRMGLGEFDKIDQHGWKVNSMKTIIHNLGHDNTIIDFLKIDIEYNEWASFRSMISDGALRNVKQFAFEIHTSELQGMNRQSTPSEFLSWYNELLELEKQGFRRFHHHHNPYGNYYSSRTQKERTCCYELYYININFLKS